MKKLLFMLSSMNIGGVEKSFLSLLSVLSKEKYDVTVLLLEKRGGFLEYIPSWVRVEEASWYKKIKPVIMGPPQQTLLSLYKSHQFQKIPSFTGVYYYSKKRDDRHLYYKHVLKEATIDPTHYDVAIAFQGPTDIIDFYIVNKINAHKKISWVHFDVSHHLINKKLYTKLYSRFDQIFSVSEAAKEQLVNLIPSVKNKVSVIKNIISPELIKEMSVVPVEFDSSYKGLRIVTVGRLSKEKGQDRAIQLLSMLRQEGYDVRWYCIGEGNARKEYENLIEQYHLKKYFLLLGEKTNPYPYIAKADLYVQTSRHESFCLTLAEAKVLKKPIVSTNFLGAYEQLKDGFNGLIAQDNNDLYSKVKQLIKSPDLQNELIQNLRYEKMDTSSELSILEKLILF